MNSRLPVASILFSNCQLRHLSLLPLSLMLSTCGDLSLNRGNSEPGVRTLTPSAATIADATKLEIEGGNLVLKKTGTASYTGCTKTAADSATTSAGAQPSNPLLTDAADRAAQSFTAATWMRVRQAVVRFHKAGGPPGNLLIDLFAASANVPTGASLGGTVDLAVSGIAAGGTGNDYTIDFESSIDVNSGQYALVGAVDQTSAVPGNYINWVRTNGSASACSDFSDYQAMQSPAGSYSTVAGKRLFFAIVADTFSPTAMGSWIMSAYQNAIWDMSTFAADENPNGSGGTIRYDIGAGTDPFTATYESVGLTLAQVKAHANLIGAYFYLRANFATPTPYFDRAELGVVSIDAK